jgi:uncharacterized protein YijF (DUF1287 family)
MSRSRSGFYSTIEYIGPRPQKPKRRNFFGGWVIIAIALGIGFWFGKPLLPSVKAANSGPTLEQAGLQTTALRNSARFGDQLAGAALALSAAPVAFDSSYYKISYPGGDIPASKGMAADVVIRAYRALHLDFQQLVHEDMTGDFRLYPQLWDASAPDSNIDHRRVPNLQRFFERHAQTITPSRNARDYQFGDVVTWSLANGDTHIGIVVPGPGEHSSEAWVIHQLGAGVKWENVLFDFKVQRHFRFPSATGN